MEKQWDTLKVSIDGNNFYFLKQLMTISYNVQIVTDAKNKLIVDFDMTNDINDINQLSNMAMKAKRMLGVDQITATADMG